MAKRVARTRNGGRWTEAAFWGMFNRDIDKRLMYWKCGDDYLNSLRRLKTEASGPGKHQYEYPCEHCKKWFRREGVERDHKISVGKVTCIEDFKTVIEGKFIEIDGGWQCLCIDCHLIKSNTEKYRCK
jgi:hypothetical protein